MYSISCMRISDQAKVVVLGINASFGDEAHLQILRQGLHRGTVVNGRGLDDNHHGDSPDILISPRVIEGNLLVQRGAHEAIVRETAPTLCVGLEKCVRQLHHS
jgi:hypothetical protein